MKDKRSKAVISDTLITRAGALRLEASRLRTISEDLERMAAALERGDAGHEMISRYRKI